MIITTKLTRKEYINATLTTVFARPFIRYFLGILGLIILINVSLSISKGETTLPALLPPLIIIAIFLSVFYFTIRRGYSNNSRISETLQYTFGENNLIIVGESFKTELTWNKVYKVTKTKNWLLIWHSRQSANAIPRKDISGDELTNLKIILITNQVKNNL